MDTLSPDDSPVKSASEADRDIIVRSVLQFVDPEVAAALRATSFGYETSVARAQRDAVLNKRKVEELIGEELPNVAGKDWAATYALATTFPLALMYTTTDPVDEHVGEARGQKRYDQSTPAASLASRHLMVKDAKLAAEAGNVLALKVFLVFLGPLTSDQYWSIIDEGITNGHLGVLEVPEIFAALQTAQPGAVESVLKMAANEAVSPLILDFVFANMDLVNSVFDQFPHLYRMIRDGLISSVSVLLKHDLFDPFQKVIGDQNYMNKDYVHGLVWWPIWLAASFGHTDMVALFLEDDRLSTVDSFKFSLRNIVIQGHEQVFRMLYDTGKLEEEGGEDEYLDLAAQAGYLDIARVIFERLSEDSWVFNNRVLCIAVNNNRTEIALLILSSPIITLTQQGKNQLIATAKYNGNLTLERAIRLHG